jgi:hypothetical protein
MHQVIIPLLLPYYICQLIFKCNGNIVGPNNLSLMIYLVVNYDGVSSCLWYCIVGAMPHDLLFHDIIDMLEMSTVKTLV